MSIAYIDGRDPEAQPPLTIQHINIWKRAPSEPMQRIKMQLQHGARVTVLQIIKHNGRNWAQIKKGWRVGWILESFLSNKREEPIGDLIL